MVFVSYSRAEINQVRPVVDRLRRNGVECWLDESNIPVGAAFVVRLGEALARANAFLLIDTPASRASYWVKRERTVALRFANERRSFLIARMFSEVPADLEGPWSISVAFTPAGEEGLLDVFRNQLGRDTSVTQTVLAHNNVREGQFGQPENWVGRHDELDILDEWWAGSVPGAWVRGLGGSGKSGLIQTWVTALEDLGYDRAPPLAVLFLPGRAIESSGQSESPLRSFLKRTIEIQHKLVVLDGFDEASDTRFVEKLLHDALTCGAKVLVSSRQEIPKSLVGSFVAIALNTMSRRESVAFLNQMGMAGPDAIAVAAELGDHPLAVLLFARYVAERNLKPTDALKDLRSHTLRHDAAHKSVHERAASAIGDTVQRAIDAVSPRARRLLSGLCQIDAVELRWPECLPSNISESDATAAVQELSTAGLVQVDRLDAPSRMAIHDLIRDLVKGQGVDRVW
jgi:hypothetical protein